MSWTALNSVIGVPIRDYVKRQLKTRVETTIKSIRGEDTVKYFANKSSWVRLVSSVDLMKTYNVPGLRGYEGSYLAKDFVLHGGTSKYNFAYSIDNSNTNDGPRLEESFTGYKLRSGFSETYGMLGPEEVKNYGYVPMPGITSVQIAQQGRLGSLKQATVQFRVNSKQQLDIIDALYFRPGFSALLEWGNTMYFDNEGNLKSSEDYTIDPFASNYDVDTLRSQIVENNIMSNGNYDALIGVITQYNFSFQANSGYNCTLTIVGLGILGESIRMNNAAGMYPDILESNANILAELKKRLENKKRAELVAAELEKVGDFGTTVQVKNLINNTTKLTGVNEVVRKNNSFVAELSDYIVKYKNNEYLIIQRVGSANANNDQIILPIPALSTEEAVGQELQSAVISIDNLTGVNLSATGNSVDKVVEEITRNGPDSVNPGLATSAQYKLQRTAVSVPGPFTNNTLDYFITKGLGGNGFYYYGSRGLYASNVTDSEINKDYNGVPGPVNASAAVECDFYKFRAQLNYQIEGDPTYYIRITSSPIENVDSSTGYSQPNQIIRFPNLQSKEFYGPKPNPTIIQNVGSDNIENTSYPVILKQKQNKSPLYVSPKDGVDEFEIDGTALTNKIFKEVLTGGAQGTLQVIRSVGKTAKDSRLVFRIKGVKIPLQDLYSTHQKSRGLSTEFSVSENGGVTNYKYFVGKPYMYVDIEFNDSALITRTTPPTNELATDLGVSQLTLVSNLDDEKKLQDAATKEAKASAEKKVPPVNVSEITKSEASRYSSHIELMLRSIQLYSYASIVQTYKDAAQGVINNMISTKFLSKQHQKFLYRLFSNGALERLRGSVADINKDAEAYKKMFAAPKFDSYDDFKKDPSNKYLLESYFGFCKALMAKPTKNQYEEYVAGELKDIEIDYASLLQSIVIPYNQSQGMSSDSAALPYPCYMPFGFFMCLINHVCLLYENKQKEKNKPLVYVDFNPQTNVCMKLPSTVSTNPYMFMVPFEGTNADYRKIFDSSILNQAGTFFKPKVDENDKEEAAVPLHDFEKKNKISQNLIAEKLGFMDNVGQGGNYRGKIMNVLVNIDYLLRVLKSKISQNETNTLVLKGTLEQIVSDMNKTLGNVNFYRVAYSDESNCFYISDDQRVPTKTVKGTDDTETFYTFPIYGKHSLCESFDIKTEINNRLGNLIAISANSTIETQATAGKDATAFGQASVGMFKDRYKNEIHSVNDIKTENKNKGDTKEEKKNIQNATINAAIQFNAAMEAFYSGDFGKNNSAIATEEKAEQATNYLIDGLAKVKANDEVSKSSAMIPINISFTMDGISGLSMGSAFLVDEQVLPYSYNRPMGDRKPGFIVTGTDHALDGNRWKTTVKGSMMYLSEIYPDTKAEVQGEKAAQSEGPGKKEPPYPNRFDLGVNPEVTKLEKDLKAIYKDRVNTVGIWGDSSHQQRRSDHNEGNALDTSIISPTGVVDTALGNEIAQKIINEADKRSVTYIIFNKREWTRKRGWHPYTGDNPHVTHVHTSFKRNT